MAVDITFWKNMKYTLYGTLIFMILINPVTQAIIQSLLIIHNTQIEYLVNSILFFSMMLCLLMFVKS
jgi:hypothetical protein